MNQLFTKKTIAYLGGLLLLCQTPVVAQKNSPLQTGIWRATLGIYEGKQELPFNLEIQAGKNGSFQAALLNGKERLEIKDIKQKNDSLLIPMHIFDAAIVAKIQDGGKTLSGLYRKYDGKDPNYSLPFRANVAEKYRFKTQNAATANVAGRWDVMFRDDGGQDSTQAVGIFEQEPNGQVSGTFLTTTGDYRFLAGQMNGNLLQLSCFDGSHAFLFTAEVNGKELRNGNFWAGAKGHESWTAKFNPKAALPDAGQLTHLKAGYQRLDFSFPDLNQQKVSLSDKKFAGKVVIVQLLGSWCPNCMDETLFLSEWYKSQDRSKVAIIGLAFERKKEFEYAKGRLEILKKRFNINYDLLIAGIANKDSAAAALPALDHVLAFPTTLILDKKGTVRYIHTGFSGQGTGTEYEQFVADFRKKIAALEGE